MGNCNCNEEQKAYILKKELLEKMAKYIDINDRSLNLNKCLLEIKNKNFHKAVFGRSRFIRIR